MIPDPTEEKLKLTQEAIIDLKKTKQVSTKLTIMDPLTLLMTKLKKDHRQWMLSLIIAKNLLMRSTILVPI